LLSGLIEKLLLKGLVAAFDLRTFKQGLAELIDHFIIFAEIEPALFKLRIPVFEDTAKFGDRLVKIAVLFVHQSVQPGHGPARRGGIERGGALQRADRVLEPAFFEIDAGEIERTIGASELFHGGKGLPGLDQLTFFAASVTLEKQTDAVIVPTLPEDNGGICIGRLC